MGLLKPTEINVMRSDLQALVDGPDGTDAVLHWSEGSGAQDSYGEHDVQVEQSENIRVHIVPITNILQFVRGVNKAGVADMQTGDHILYLKPDVDLNRAGIWFEVPGIGNFTPESRQPVASHVQGVLYPNGNKLIQEVYCRLKR